MALALCWTGHDDDDDDEEDECWTGQEEDGSVCSLIGHALVDCDCDCDCDEVGDLELVAPMIFIKNSELIVN